MTAAVPTKDMEADNDLRMHLQAWKESAQEKPLRLLVCGLGGVGKSTLVNRLLKLEEGNRAKVGRSGGATTIDVSEYESSIERGLKVRFFYPPGFIDVNHPDEGIVATILEKTESKLDLFLYCISLSHPTRVQQSDASAFQLLTRSLGSEIWNKAVIVLTFANALEDNKKDADEYLEVVKRMS